MAARSESAPMVQASTAIGFVHVGAPFSGCLEVNMVHPSMWVTMTMEVLAAYWLFEMRKSTYMYMDQIQSVSIHDCPSKASQAAHVMGVWVEKNPAALFVGHRHYLASENF